MFSRNDNKYELAVVMQVHVGMHIIKLKNRMSRRLIGLIEFNSLTPMTRSASQRGRCSHVAWRTQRNVGLPVARTTFQSPLTYEHQMTAIVTC